MKKTIKKTLLKTTPKTIFDPRYKTLVAEMVKLRKSKGISQVKLSELSGRSKTSIARTELRERRLDLIDTIDLLKAMGLSNSEILKIIEKLLK